MSMELTIFVEGNRLVKCIKLYSSIYCYVSFLAPEESNTLFNVINCCVYGKNFTSIFFPPNFNKTIVFI